MRTRAGHGNTQPAHLSSGDIERNRRVLLEVHGQVDGTLACIVEGAADLGLLLLIQVEARLRVVADPAARKLLLVDVNVARLVGAAALEPEQAMGRVLDDIVLHDEAAQKKRWESGWVHASGVFGSSCHVFFGSTHFGHVFFGSTRVFGSSGPSHFLKHQT